MAAAGAVRSSSPYLLRNSELVAKYERGEWVGDLSLLSGTPHSVEAVAVTAGMRLIIGTGPFRAAVRHHPDVAFELIKVLVARIYHISAIPQPYRRREGNDVPGVV